MRGSYLVVVGDSSLTVVWGLLSSCGVQAPLLLWREVFYL